MKSDCYMLLVLLLVSVLIFVTKITKVCLSASQRKRIFGIPITCATDRFQTRSQSLNVNKQADSNLSALIVSCGKAGFTANHTSVFEVGNDLILPLFEPKTR